MKRSLLFLCAFILVCSGCHPPTTDLQPYIQQPPHPKEMFRNTRSPYEPSGFSDEPSPFPPLSEAEKATDWGKEYWIGLRFAADFDLYRAITDFKRALLLLPESAQERRMEIEYQIALSYYFGKKYQETIYQFESSELSKADATFPAFPDLLLMLYDCYHELGNEVQGGHILSLIDQFDPLKAEKLRILNSVKKVDLASLYEVGCSDPKRSYLETIVSNYRRDALSVKKAEMLNALLPGAGYWYVGQRETAITSFVVNSLFLAAAACFFHYDNIPAGIITLSLESGWYVGGIWGGGLAARYHNERVYESYADKITAKENYFPQMMIRYSF